MRAFTPDVREVLNWFARTHELDAVGLSGVVVWRQRLLPEAGGLGDQPAWLIEALDFTRFLKNELLAKRRAADVSLAEWHDRDIQRRPRHERTH